MAHWSAGSDRACTRPSLLRLVSARPGKAGRTILQVDTDSGFDVNDSPSRRANPVSVDRSPRDERQAAQDLVKAGYRPAAQRGHIERLHGTATITTERVWSAMREVLARG